MSREHLTIIEELKQTLARVDESELEAILTYFDQSHSHFFAGAGRSGFAVRGFSMRVMHMGFSSYFVGEPTTPSIHKGDVLFIASGSGRTASLVAMAEKAKALGAKVLLFTIDAGSPIAKLADAVVRIPAPSPKVEGDTGFSSTQPMGSLAEQTMSILFDTLVLKLMDMNCQTGDEMFQRHANLE